MQRPLETETERRHTLGQGMTLAIGFRNALGVVSMIWSSRSGWLGIVAAVITAATIRIPALERLPEGGRLAFESALPLLAVAIAVAPYSSPMALTERSLVPLPRLVEILSVVLVVLIQWLCFQVLGGLRAREAIDLLVNATAAVGVALLWCTLMPARLAWCPLVIWWAVALSPLFLGASPISVQGNDVWLWPASVVSLGSVATQSCLALAGIATYWSAGRRDLTRDLAWLRQRKGRSVETLG